MIPYKRIFWLLLTLLFAFSLTLTACEENTPKQKTPPMPEGSASMMPQKTETTRAAISKQAPPTASEPTPTPTSRPQTSLGIVIPGNTQGWLNSDIWLEAGDTLTMTASGTINIWPNCEETKVSAGFPNLDCILVTQIGPGGTNAFEPANENYPYPGGPVAALVGKVTGNAPILVGDQLVYTVDSAGMLAFAINDVSDMADNGGEFVVQLTIPYAISPTIRYGRWQESDIMLTAGQTFTVTASGNINMWPNCEETKDEQGFPGFDCSQTAAVGPNGTDAFSPGLEDYPLPGANTLALVGRVGNSNVFLIGEGGMFVAPQSGPLLLAINDTAYWKQDDQGIFIVTVNVGNPEEVINLQIP